MLVNIVNSFVRKKVYLLTYSYAPKNPEEKLPAAAPQTLDITRIPSAKVWISDFTKFAIVQVKKISAPVRYNAAKIQ